MSERTDGPPGKVSQFWLAMIYKYFPEDSRSVVFDLEGLTREEIEKELITTLGKTEIVRKRESLEKIAKLNPASFGSNCPRQCMCEVQGQHPCTALLHAPSIYTGKYRWNHNLI